MLNGSALLFLVDSIGLPTDLPGKLSLFLLNEETDYDLLGGVTDRLRPLDSVDLSMLTSLRIATSSYLFGLLSEIELGSIAAEEEWTFLSLPRARAP